MRDRDHQNAMKSFANVVEILEKKFAMISYMH